MEAAAGAVTARTVLLPAAATTLRREAGWVGSSRVSVRPHGGFADDGHLRYYASPARCGGRGLEEKKVVKRREKLLKGLAALQGVGNGVGLAVVLGETEERKITVKEVADVLLAQLELLRAEEKEMRRRKKEEKKAAMRAAAKQMKACDDSEDSDSEDEEEEMKGENKMEKKDSMKVAANQVVDCSGCKESSHKEMKGKKKEEKAAMKAAHKLMKVCDESEDASSSSSSESSDSDCEEEVMYMRDLKTVPTDVEPATGKVQMETLKGELNLPSTVSVTEEGAKAASALKCDPECSGSIVSNVVSNASTCCSSGIASGVGSNTSTCCSSNGSIGQAVMAAEAVVPMERIEVCMGGKCKKSGAIELLQEFERRVGIEGAVVGCKCMGKCREGPNVRVRNMHSEGDEHVMVMKNPLCIGVGLDDVGTIVANFFADKKDMGLLAA